MTEGLTPWAQTAVYRMESAGRGEEKMELVQCFSLQGDIQVDKHKGAVDSVGDEVEVGWWRRTGVQELGWIGNDLVGVGRHDLQDKDIFRALAVHATVHVES